jgi:DNA-binding transcriptional LysR family regulator
VAKDKVKLTPQGRRLFDFCAPFFEELPAVVRAIRADEFGGELRIDAVGLTIRGLLPRWIRRLRDEHPDIRVVLEEVTDPDVDRLRIGAADLIVDYIPEAPPEVELIQVATAYAFVTTASDHAFAQRKRLALGELADEPFISYPPGTHHYELQMNALRRLKLAPSRTVSAANVGSILSFVEAGLGFSLVPWLDRDGPALPNLAARKLTGDGSTFPIHAAWRPGPTENPLVNAALRAAPTKRSRL